MLTSLSLPFSLNLSHLPLHLEFSFCLPFLISNFVPSSGSNFIPSAVLLWSSYTLSLNPPLTISHLFLPLHPLLSHNFSFCLSWDSPLILVLSFFLPLQLASSRFLFYALSLPLPSRFLSPILLPPLFLSLRHCISPPFSIFFSLTLFIFLLLIPLPISSSSILNFFCLSLSTTIIPPPSYARFTIFGNPVFISLLFSPTYFNFLICSIPRSHSFQSLFPSPSLSLMSLAHDPFSHFLSRFLYHRSHSSSSWSLFLPLLKSHFHYPSFSL